MKTETLITASKNAECTFWDGTFLDNYGTHKLYKKRTSATVRCVFFSERVVNTWNNLPNSVDFTNLTKFVSTVKRVDVSGYLRCF